MDKELERASQKVIVELTPEEQVNQDKGGSTVVGTLGSAHKVRITSGK